MAKTKLYIMIDASFANNKDLSSQIGYIIVFGNQKKNEKSFKLVGNIVHWSFTKCKRVTRSVLVATPLRTGRARWAARDHPTRGAFLLQLRVPVLELWLSHLQQRNTNPLHPAVQNLTHPPFYTRTYEYNGFCYPTLINN
jgi:hypothetical protein